MSPRKGANKGKKPRAAKTKASATPAPPLVEREKPGLVDTLVAFPRVPWACQSCGTGWDKTNPLARWLEYDPYDNIPAPPLVPRVVVLCAACSARLIEPHPRQYKELSSGAPFPGCMAVCRHCVYRVQGADCAHPDRTSTAGHSALRFVWKKGEAPTGVHLNFGGGRGGMLAMYHGPVQSCSGFTPSATAAQVARAEQLAESIDLSAGLAEAQRRVAAGAAATTPAQYDEAAEAAKLWPVPPMMVCGHAANAVWKDGDGVDRPCCAICDGPRSTTIADVAPDLTGRMARCASYGGKLKFGAGRGSCECSECEGAIIVDGQHRGYDESKRRTHCRCMRVSSPSLAFFKHEPTKPFDAFYCGCFGWD